MRKATTSLRNVIRRSSLHTHDIVKEPRHTTTKVTTLPNKIRVATENTPGHFSALGLYVDAGTRYETSSTTGISHFVDRMAFKVSMWALLHGPVRLIDDSDHNDTLRDRYGISNGQTRRTDSMLVLTRSPHVSINALSFCYACRYVAHCGYGQ